MTSDGVIYDVIISCYLWLTIIPLFQDESTNLVEKVATKLVSVLRHDVTYQPYLTIRCHGDGVSCQGDGVANTLRGVVKQVDKVVLDTDKETSSCTVFPLI